MISFANRIRDTGTRILEARRISAGRIDEDFRTNTESSIIECFKRGLKWEIEQRPPEGANLTDIVINAIKIERQLEAKRGLRQSVNIDVQSKQVAKKVFACQACQVDTHETKDCWKNKTCDFCKKKMITLKTDVELKRKS